MSGKQLFRNGFVENGSTVYVLHRSTVTYRDSGKQSHVYEIKPYTVVKVGKDYLTAQVGADTAPKKRIERFEPIASVRPGCGLYLESTTVINSFGNIWRNCLFLHQRLAETCMEDLKKIDAERSGAGGGGDSDGTG